MTFEEVKNLINFMEEHPYVILRKIQISCHLWWASFKQVVGFVEEHLNDQEINDLEAPLDEEAYNAFQTGLMFLPAIMLAETDEKSWEIYEAIILLTQNYAEMVQDEKINRIAETLGSLIQAKNSWQTLMIQCESMILQAQSTINASNTPYNLSRKFLTSLLKSEE